ncbi:thiamine pyrophosphate-dependent enzyme [Thermotoga sp. KOL6]|uniref:thiamine pyrophosphate-dependent enzyme n=1 Tax=Thermotoga sp. KOL6 TaxID=126741 RepID=UPI000C7798DD|nr:thiamine pyrophosphate-dependent enzyme [Thermotoga sp. KOL6]PLV59888.1 2-oxoacid ferredoxin oxidoreductase [Thermotoga sp. KOL6]
MKLTDYINQEIAWCPGCGNFGIRTALMKTLEEMNVDPRNVVIVSGIGQAAKMPQYIGVNMFNGLHGRALPVATAIKTANPNLLVIAESGDGCMYGEGGNHFIHTIRRNPDIVNIVHNNQIYGLTKGQASPTSLKGFKTPVQVDGVILEPFNPLAVAIALDASFVARTFIGDIEFTKEILKEAIKHKGYALVDIFQPCVTFNKLNTYEWYKENTYYLKNHDPTDRELAFKRATETEKFPLGIFYINKNKETFEEAARKGNRTPLYEYEVDFNKLKKVIESKRS